MLELLCVSTRPLKYFSTIRSVSSFSKMAAVGVSFVSLLNAVAWHCRLPSVSYLWELDGNDILLAGVELALPSDESPSKTVSKFFWIAASDQPIVSHEMVAHQAVRFLQAKYGFAVHDYNLQTLLSYRQIAASAVDAALTASTHLARFRARYGPMDLSCECILRQCIALWSNFVKEDHFFYSTYRP